MEAGAARHDCDTGGRGECSWYDRDRSFWRVDVTDDGVAVTYCYREPGRHLGVPVEAAR